MPYLIPENDPLPSGLKCISFYYPDNVVYRRALITAYEFFSYWTAWQRDEQKTARDVANLWKEARDLSSKDNYMCNVTVNLSPVINCGSCGSSGGSASAESIYNSTQQTSVTNNYYYPQAVTSISEIPQELQDIGILTIEEYDNERCRLANYLADLTLDAIQVFDSAIEYVVGATTEGLIQRATAAVLIALSDGPQISFADLGALTVLLAPKLAGWWISSTYDSDIVQNVVSLTKEELVSHYYNGGISGNIDTIFSKFIEPALAIAPASPSMLAIYANYHSYIFGQRWSNWLSDNLTDIIQNRIPEGYVSEIPCASSGGSEYLFQSDLEGWQLSSDSFNAQVFWHATTWAGNSEWDNALRIGVVALDQHYLGKAIKTGGWPVLPADSYFQVNMSNHWTYGSWQDIRLTVTLSDQSVISVVKDGKDSQQETLDFLMGTEHAGKQIQSVEVGIDSSTGPLSNFYSSKPYTVIRRVALMV